MNHSHGDSELAAGMEPILEIRDINEWGDMCGKARRIDDTVTSTAWAYDALLDETNNVGEVLANDGIFVWAMNSLGQLAGSLHDATTNTYHAFRYTPGEGFDIFVEEPSHAPAASDNIFAYGISELGEVVGYSHVKFIDHYRRGGKDPVYGYQQSVMVSDPVGTGWTNLGTFGGLTRGTDINSSGVIVGFSGETYPGFRHVFVYLDGTMYKLQDLVLNLPAGITGLRDNSGNDYPVRINEVGQIAGIVVYDDGRPNDIFIATPVPVGP